MTKTEEATMIAKFRPTDTNRRLGEVQRVLVKNERAEEYADLFAAGLLRRGRDGYLAWTRRAAARVAEAAHAAERRAYPLATN